jgi:hypothetical protein
MTTREPAAIAEVVRLVIVALVALGWLTLDDAAANIIASAIGAVLSVILTVTVRAHVIPVESTGPTSQS